MQLSHNEDKNFSLSRFESMLKTNTVLFFDAEEFEEIINHYMEIGKVSLAKKATKMALEQHPTSVNLKLFQVEMYVFENKLDIAEALLDDIFGLDSSNEELFIQKANILSRKEKHLQAIEELKKALEVSDDEADIFNMIGLEYLFLEDYENAKYNFMKCLELDEYDYTSLYNVVYCFEFLNQFDEAIDYLSVYLDKNPYCEVAWHQLGKIYYQTKKYKKALAAYDFAIISDDQFVGAYLEKGKVLEKLKRYNDAIESYTVSLNLEDPTSFALLRIGKCYQKLGNDELALQFYTKCVEEDSLLDKGWIAITDFYYKKKDYQKALHFIGKALHIDGENVHYWKRYAKINHKLQLLEEAEVGYRKTLELGNFELETWLTRADILACLGEHQAAIINLNQAADFYTEEAEVEYRLAALHYFLGEKIKGRFHLENGLRINKEYSIIIDLLFPKVYQQKEIQDIINETQKTT